MNLEAILAALEQAKQALDQIEMEAARQGPPEEPPEMEEEAAETPPGPGDGMGGMMGRKPPAMG